MSNKSIIFKLIPISLILVLCSCVHHPKYPEKWAALTPDEDISCINISGIYKNLSDNPVPSTPDEYKLSLSCVLSKYRKNFECRKATHVKINQLLDGKVEILSINGEDLMQKDVLIEEDNDYECQSTMLIIPSSDGYVATEILGGVEFGSLTLMKSTDNSLVLKTKSSGFGLAIIFPFIVSESEWYRFKPYQVSQ